MKKIAFILAAFICGILNAEVLNGVYVTNDQGILYEDTVIDCDNKAVVDRNTDNHAYKKLVEYYFRNIEKLNKYGELHVKLEVVDYLPIDKVKYPKDHWDATATVKTVLSKSYDQVIINECLGNS